MNIFGSFKLLKIDVISINVFRATFHRNNFYLLFIRSIDWELDEFQFRWLKIIGIDVIFLSR